MPLGPTNKFPQGKLNTQDDGELQLAISSAQGNVIIHFGTKVSWLGLPPTEARAFARALLKHADKIESQH
jgi:hypothetical protein